MFEQLTAAERKILADKLNHASEQFFAEWEALKETAPSMLPVYSVGPRFGTLVSDWLMAGAETAALACAAAPMVPAR